MVGDTEALEQELPFREYARDTMELTKLVTRLEHLYDKREKIIGRIMEYGTGIESEKALRMYSIPVLEKWEAALESFRAEQLKSQPGSANLKTDIAMMRSDIARLRAAQAKASAEERARLQARIEQLHAKLHARLAGTERKLKSSEAAARVKAQAFKSKAATDRNMVRAAAKARIAKVRAKHKSSEANQIQGGGIA
jgi:chromosome segregation ATPase